eukprot:1187637-Prorocentrum_minimum.AAC.2
MASPTAESEDLPDLETALRENRVYGLTSYNIRANDKYSTAFDAPEWVDPSNDDADKNNDDDDVFSSAAYSLYNDDGNLTISPLNSGSYDPPSDGRRPSSNRRIEISNSVPLSKSTEYLADDIRPYSRPNSCLSWRSNGDAVVK